MDILSMLNQDAEQLGKSVKKNAATVNRGEYRPNLKELSEYTARLRFLPNINQAGEVNEPSYYQKDLFYVNVDQRPEFRTVFDGQRTFNDGKCPINEFQMFLKKNESVVLRKKADYLRWQRRHYAYVQIIEDDQFPEFNDKVMVYVYPPKIQEKIQAELDGKTFNKKRVNPFNPFLGKDFFLQIKMKDGYVNYDSSRFVDAQSPIVIDGEPLACKVLPNGGLDVPADSVKRLVAYVSNHEGDLEDFHPRKLTDEQFVKFEELRQYILGDTHEVEQIVQEKAKTAAKFMTPGTAMDKNPFEGTIASSEDDDDPFSNYN